MKRTYLHVTGALIAAAMLAVSCSSDKGTPDPGPGSETEIQEWMFAYMKTHYLWNDAVKNVTPDYKLEYTDFLGRVLRDVAAQNDVNHDDGHWEKGVRTGFYSNIDRYKTASAQSKSRSLHKTTEGMGVSYIVYDDVPGMTGEYYLILMGVSPGSPVAKAGLDRGSLILRVGGEKITDKNLEACWKQLTTDEAGHTVTLTTGVLSNGKLVEGSEMSVTSASYDDNPVWVTKVLTAENGRDKIGYLVYNSFNMNYDQQLMNAFREFKSQDVRHLILDLRNNGGGHLVSSLLMGTMIAGNAKKDQVFLKQTTNKDRTAKGDAGSVYTIGGNYDAAKQGLQEAYALGLNSVYILCTENTASASEAVINGLRGIGIDVRLVGETTNGKNVGMEPVVKEKDGYEYEFSPITFYSENAVGSKDYSSGFMPEVLVHEFWYDIYPWGDVRDPLLGTALKWINTGVKPSGAAVAEVRSAVPERKALKRRDRLEGLIVLPGSDLK